MSLPIHLQSIKSSGVYRFVYDKSVISSDTAEILRLVVGYSDKGPFNTPVYITSRDEFIRTYGNISKRLEKRGVFFHRIALQALNAGPILALNLKPFDNTNLVENVTFDASTVYGDLSDNRAQNDETVINIYDTNRFWTLNFDDLAEYADKKFAIISATDSEASSCTVIVRPTHPYEYQIPIREYYAGSGNEMPEYLEPVQDELLSNYFADIYVFRGQFTPELCEPGKPFAKYFNVNSETGEITLEENYVDAFGNKADVLEAIANDESSNYIAAYRGTSIPFFKNAQGSYISLDLLFNSGYMEHKMLMKLDESLLDNIDLNSASADEDVNKYLKFSVIEDINDYAVYYAKKSEEIFEYNEIDRLPDGETATTIQESQLDNVDAQSPEYAQIQINPGVEPAEYKYYKKNSHIEFSYEELAASAVTDEIKDRAEKADEVPDATDVSPEYIVTPKLDKIKYYERVITDYGYSQIGMNPSKKIQKIVGENVASSAPESGVSEDAPQYIKVEIGTNVYMYYERIAVAWEYQEIQHPSKNILKEAVEVATIEPDEGVKGTDPEYVKMTVSIEAESIHPVYIKGFEYKNLDGLDNYTNEILSVITGDYGKGLQEALTNRIDVEYHYLIDSFGTIAGPQGAADKKILSALARKKDNCLAILNFPKVKDFIKAKKYNTNNTLDFKKVVKDFVLPDEADGASWCGFFTQVVVNENSVQYTIPSAGLISNLFIDKWGARQPYYIIAGSQYGRLYDNALIGPDYAFAKDDRDVLEPYGINVIIYEPRRGTYINSEQTAKQQPVSALSKIHIRELVIYLQDEIADLLESYRWELNTQVLRDKIKSKADVILETVKNNGGVYDYLNVCDESNNTGETIDNELLILDTHIEPARGAGKMVEQLYIYRTGEMRSMLLQG